jgi:hypothetical protein
MDRSTAYHVFITPDGDTRGLYVATKTAEGFIVRETQGGRGTLSFDYRIVASLDGQATRRMTLSRGEPVAPPPLGRQGTPGLALASAIGKSGSALGAAHVTSKRAALIRMQRAALARGHVFAPQANLAAERLRHF